MDGTSLGGWMVMEAWLYPNILLVQGVSPAVSPAVKGNQELDYINRMRSVDIDAIASMRALWNTYVVDDLLGSDNPDISRLVALKQAGVKYIRIPVGWWIMEAPTDVPPQYAREGGNYTMRDPGYTVDGFVSGGIVFVEKLLGLLKKLGMRAYIDVHSLPGGAVANMGYTGKFFPQAEFFDGSDSWLADGKADSNPPANRKYLTQGVTDLRAIATWISSLESQADTSGVVFGLGPWNEALLNDNVKAVTLQTAFTLKMLPQLFKLLPPACSVILNWFNNDASFWSNWLVKNGEKLGGLNRIISDVHIYHAFDASSYASGCPQCTSSSVAKANFLCKSCRDGAAGVTPYTSKGLRTIVGEWSLASCNMYGQNTNLINDPDDLYAMYGAEKSSFRAANASGDFFWTGLVRTDGYDPTVYSTTPGSNGTRGALEALLELYQANPSWVAANPYVQPPTIPAAPAYLLAWDLFKLGNLSTSDGHKVAMPVTCNASDASDGLCITGSCVFEPAPLRNLTAAVADGANGYMCNPASDCKMAPWASPTVVQEQLVHVCTQISCAAILPGGAHFEPNTLQNHADYAFNKWYSQHRSDTGLHGIVCFLDGAAYLSQC